MGVRIKSVSLGTQYTLICDECKKEQKFTDMKRGDALLFITKHCEWTITDDDKLLCPECSGESIFSIHKEKPVEYGYGERIVSIKGNVLWVNIPTINEFIKEQKALGRNVHKVWNRHAVEPDGERFEWDEEDEYICNDMNDKWNHKLPLIFTEEVIAIAKEEGLSEKELHFLYRDGKIKRGTGVDTLRKYLRTYVGDKFIRLEDIKYARYPENMENKKVIDMCHIIVNPCISDKKKRREWVIKYKEDILKYAYKEISLDNKFKKYGVPVNIFKVENMTITADGLISITLIVKELKEKETKSK